MVATDSSRGHQQRSTGAPAWPVVVFVGLVLAGTILSYGSETLGTGEGNVLRQALYLGVFALAVVSPDTTREHRRLAVPPELLLLAAWCALSLTWALEPGVGARRLGLTSLVAATVFVLAAKHPFDAVVRSLLAVLTAAVAVSYAVVFAWPAMGIHQIDLLGDPNLVGSWRGIMPEKNTAGAVCALALILLLLAGRQVPPVVRWPAMAAIAVFLYGTNSKTSMIALGAGLLAAALFALHRSRFRSLAVPLVLLGAAVGLVALLSGSTAWFQDLMLKPDAFTGRTQIWLALWAYATDHPTFGSGFGSFWNIGPSSPIYQYGNDWIVLIAQGHNGYLDLLVQIGWPGLLLAVAACLVLPASRLLASHDVPRRRGALLMAVLVFAAVHNLSESTLLDRDAVVNVFLFFAIALIASARAGSGAEAA